MDKTQALTDGGYQMLREAVDMVRDHQCPTVSRLKERLLAVWPGRAQDIDSAVKFWAADVKKRYPNGVPRH